MAENLKVIHYNDGGEIPKGLWMERTWSALGMSELDSNSIG